MKQFYAADLHTQTEITDFFMVKSAGIKVGSNKKQYFDVLLGDKTGEVNSKKWDISEREAPVLAAIKEGDIIKVRAQVTDWQGQTQLRIGRIRMSNPEDGLDVSDYIKTRRSVLRTCTISSTGPLTPWKTRTCAGSAPRCCRTTGTG